MSRGRAHLDGLLRCGSVWECPVCSWAIRTERAKEVQQVADWHRARGGALYLLSLTVRHGFGDDLRALRTGVAKAWRSVQGGAPWTRFKDRFGLCGIIRALEVTHGANGFHPHLHALLLFDKELSAAELREARTFISLRWQRAVGRQLASEAVPNDLRGCDLRSSHSTQYIAKLGLALELTAPTGKEGRGESRAMLQIALDFTNTGDEADGFIWRTYAEGIRGARMLTWTRGLRTAAGLGENTSDEELLDSVEQSEELVAVISGPIWAHVRDVRGAIVAILEAAEFAGANGVDAVLARLRARARPSHLLQSG